MGLHDLEAPFWSCESMAQCKDIKHLPNSARIKRSRTSSDPLSQSVAIDELADHDTRYEMPT